MKALFAWEIEKGDPLRHLDYISRDWEMAGFVEGQSEAFLKELDSAYAKRLACGVQEHKGELDKIIGEYSVDWEIDRLGGAERNILRLSLYEMLFDEKLAPAIAINEALDLIKIYGSQEAAKFVNGVLGKKAEELKAQGHFGNENGDGLGKGKR